MQRNMTFGSDEKRVAPLLRQEQHLTPQTHQFWVATYSHLTVFLGWGPHTLSSYSILPPKSFWPPKILGHTAHV